MSAANNATYPSTTSPAIDSGQLTLALRVITTVATVVALGAVIYYLLLGINYRNRTFPGFMMSYTLVVDGNASLGATTPWAAQDAGLSRLDRIISVNGTQLATDNYAEARNAFWEAFDTVSYGDTVEVGFVRAADAANASSELCDAESTANGFVPCTVTYTTSPLPNSDYFTYFAFPIGSAAIALLVGLTLLYYRPNHTTSLLVTLFCMGLAVFSGGVFNNGTTHMVMPIWLIYTGVGGGVALTLALVFPSRPLLTYRQPVILAIPIVIGIVLTIIDLYLWANLTTPYDFTLVWQLPVGLAFVSFFVLF
ncbi:MAG: hypothetical protein AAF125_10100, partial [Chloroflexota bacterium]